MSMYKYMYMAEEEVKKEDRPSFLKEAKAEREALEKVRDDISQKLEEFKQLQSEDILSGRAPQPKQEPKIEITPQEYAQRALKGEIAK